MEFIKICVLDLYFYFCDDVSFAKEMRKFLLFSVLSVGRIVCVRWTTTTTATVSLCCCQLWLTVNPTFVSRRRKLDFS